MFPFVLLAALKVADLPPIPREFRAAWVATVDNIDWPSKRTLSTKDQKKELIHLMDAAVDLKLNALILQVRPSADSLYDSKLEPWSEYLTGLQGSAPDPYYDPLKFAIQEAHKRGLQLHCWLNPYRAKHFVQKGPLAATHIGVQRPDLVRAYGKYLWLDPGEPEVQARTIAVVKDLVDRYDIDGIHIDDYFYPYPENNQEFPDEASFAKYQQLGGTLIKADWRRSNVDKLIQTMYKTIKAEKPWVLFGISPFGIYRPGIPEGVKSGVDQYAELYADARKWLREGWCDYFTPQLYWAISSKYQSYSALINWWGSQNLNHRHLWPGLYTSRVDPKEGNWQPKEIVDQVEMTRNSGFASGNVHFSMVAFLKNVRNLSDTVRGSIYSQPAIIPESPWLETSPPVSLNVKHHGATVSWKVQGKSKPMWIAVWAKYGSQWVKSVLSASQSHVKLESYLPSGKLEEVEIRPLDRLGHFGVASRFKVK